MATEIDKRVVQMEFDNKDFERNCQASLTTLEKLKMALNFDGAKGLDSMAKAADKVDLSNLSKGAEAISVKFSAMQVAGMTAISELTKGLMNFGKKVWDSSFGLMKTGGMARTLKIEQARFQMAALAKNMEGITENAEAQAALVEKMVTAASESVSGTAYGMDAAAAVTSQLMASGVMNAETMLKHLRGIAGAASMTGRSFEDIGNIFTTVASNGRLMTMQLRQFSAAGLNLSATLGQSLGKSEDEINEMVRKGEISFEQFSKALSDAFGDAATKADDTFSGVTTNIQAQIKRIGQIFTDPFVEHVVPFLKEVKAAIQRLNGVMQPLGKTFEVVFSNIIEKATQNMKNLNVTRLSGIIYGLENIFTSLVLIADAIRKAFMDLFPPKTVDQLTQVAMDFEMFTRQLLPTKETLEGIRQIFIPLFSILKMVFNIASSLWKNVAKPLLLTVTKFMGAIIRLGNALKPFNDKLIESLNQSKFFDNVLQILTATIIILVDWVTQLITGVADLLNKIASSDTLKKFAETLQAIGNAIGNVILFALVSVFNVLKSILDFLNIDNLNDGLNTLGNTLMFIVGVIEQGFLTVFNIIEGLAGTSGILSSVWEILKEIYEIIKAFITGEDPGKHLENIQKKLEKLGEQLKTFAKQISDTMKEIGVGKLLLMAFAVGIIFLTFALIGFVDQATKFTHAATGIVSTFTGLKTAVKTFASYNGVTQVLIGLAIAIGAVTSAISTIADIAGRDSKSLDTAVKILSAFILAIMGFAIAITMLQKNLKIDSKGAAVGVLTYIAGFAIAIYALAAAVKVISDVQMSLEQAAITFGVIAALMLSLAGVSILLSNFAGPITVGAISLIGFALALKIIVTAFAQMQQLNLEATKKTLLSFVGLMVAFGTAMGLASLGGLGIGSFLGFIGAALALKILVAILDELASYPWEKIVAGLTNMALIFAPLIAFMVSAAVTNRLAMNSQSLMKDLSKLVFSFSVLLLAVAGIVALTGVMDTAALTRGMIVFTLMGMMLERLIDSVMAPLTGGNLSNNKISITGGGLKGIRSLLWGLTALMLSLTLFIKAMGSPEALKGALPSVALLSLIFGGLGMLIKNMSTVPTEAGITKVGPILALIVGLLAVMSAITILAVFFKEDEIWKFVAISASVFAIGITIASLILAWSMLNKKAKGIDIPTVQRTADEILIICLGMTAIIGAIALVIKSVSALAVTPGGLYNLIPIGIALASVIGSLIAFMVVADRSKNDRFSQTAKSITAMMLGMSVIVAVIGAAMIALIHFTKGVDILDAILIMSTFSLCVIAVLSVSALLADKMKSVLYYGSTLIKSGLFFAGIAIAFGIIAGSITACIKVLDGIPVTDVWGKMLALTVPFAALIGGVALILHLAEAINYEYFAKEMYSIGVSLLAGAGAFAVMAMAMIELIKVSTTNINESNVSYVSNVWLAMMVTFGLIWLAIFGFVKVMHTNTINTNDILLIASSMVIASSSILVIATAISEIALVANTITNTKGLAGMILAVISLAVIVMGAMLLMFKVTKTSGYSSWKDYLAMGAAVMIASTAVLIIAEAMRIIAKSVRPGNMAQVEEALEILAIIMVAFAAIMVEVGVIASKVAGVNFLAIAAGFPLIASSLLIVVGAMAILANICGTLTAGELIQVGLILAGMVVVFGALATLGGIIETMTPGFAEGMLKVIGVFAIFEIAVLAFALATDVFVDAIKRINDSDLDADKIAKNAGEAIQGVARAIKENAGEILTAVSIIIVGVMAILGAQQVKMALQAVAFVTSFVIGLAAAMPLILTALDSIFNQIIEKLENDPEMADRWEQGGRSIGKLIVHGIIGAFDGLAQEIGYAIGDALQDAKDWFDINALGGHVSLQDIYGDRAKKDQNSEYLKEYASELQDIADEKFDSNKTADDWNRIVNYINEVNNSIAVAKDLGSEFTDESIEQWNKTIENIRIPKEYINKLSAEYQGDKQQLLDALTPSDSEIKQTEVNLDTLYGPGPQQEVKTLRNDIDNTNTAITETGTSAEESSEKMDQSFKKTLTDVANTAKEKSPEIGNNLLNGLESVFGQDGFLGSMFGDFNINDYAPELKSIGGNVGDIIGNAAGKEMNKDIKSQLSYWTKYVNEVVNPSLYQATAGKKGLRWQDMKDEQGSAFKDPDAAARFKYNEYLEETNESLDASQHALKENGWSMDALTESVINGTDAVGGFGDGLNDMVDDADKAKTKLEEFRESVHDSIASAMHGIFDEVKEQEYIDPEEMLYRMSENVRQVGEWARNIATLAARGMSEGLLNELKDMGPQGAAKVQAFVDMTDEQLQMANRRWKAAEFMPDYGTKEIENAYKKAGFNASLGFAEGVDATMASDAMSEFADAGLNTLEDKYEINSPSKRTARDGEYAAMGFAVGMNSPMAQAMLRGATLKMANLVLETLDRELRPQKFQQAAYGMFDGFSTGMANRIPQILSKVTLFCSQLIATFQRVLRMHSPSKAMEDLGYNAMAGFGNGMEEGSEEVTNITDQSANDILDQMKANIAAVANGWSEDNVYQPVIRPVFDMDAINQGYSDIQSWFANSQGINLNGSISRLTPTTRDEDASTQQVIDAINRINNDDVVREIGALRDDISQLQSAMTNLQVVMNTGALVGQLVEPIDRALGSKALYNSRGRY